MNTIFLNLRKNSFKLVLLLCLALPLGSCNSDDDKNEPVKETQDPLSGFLSAAGLTKSIDKINVYASEFGMAFIPTANGQITAITAKIPNSQSAMRITLWDKQTKTVLKTETIDVAAAGVESIKTVSGWMLEKNKEYMFTVNSKDWYSHTKSDGSAIIYPITVGDIKITNYGYANGTTQEMPTSMVSTYFGGDFSFKFQKD